MRQLIAEEMVSLDGFYCGPNGELDWHRADEEFEVRASQLLDAADTLLFGRVTYEGMAAYWPTALPDPSGRTEHDGVPFVVPSKAHAAHAAVAARMNAYPKIVVSRTLREPSWGPVRVWPEPSASAVRELKESPGRDILLLGSGRLLSSLSTAGLIDRYRVWVNPIVLGRGRPLFPPGGPRTPLVLEGFRRFASGLVELDYTRAGADRAP
jgi:dihydrofolate reductase